MQDQLEVVKEIISIFLKDSKDGKKRLVEWFLNNVMEEETGIQISSLLNVSHSLQLELHFALNTYLLSLHLAG
jgi:hypothetical protein